MLELKGTHNTAKVYTAVIDSESTAQIVELLNQPFAENAKIRIMPDVHAGAGCTIGTTLTITDKIVPNLVGVDIGCGMETIKIKEKNIELQKLDKLIYAKIPSGFSVREKPHKYMENINLSALRCHKHINPLRAEISLGTLGGGNHFIEADRDENGEIYLVVHSGSRHLGLEVAQFYQNEGYQRLNKSSEKDIRALIDQYKAEGRENELERVIKMLKSTTHTSVPKHLAYVEGELFDDYIHDMKIIQAFALWNRKAMLDEIVRGMKLTVTEQFTTIHNYIDTDSMILRKGAVSAQAGEILLIPINMRDGSLICRGKGTADWNYSAPHGAGRLMSRGKARSSFTVSEFKKQMGDVYTTSVGKSTLDECPMAYKSMDNIVDNIGDTAEILHMIKPIYNFKAGED